MPDSILPLDAFVRAIGAARLTPHALFLGAGASISSGMPSARCAFGLEAKHLSHEQYWARIAILRTDSCKRSGSNSALAR